ncbi:hypothetical protein [Cellulomonas hominis]
MTDAATSVRRTLLVGAVLGGGLLPATALAAPAAAVPTTAVPTTAVPAGQGVIELSSDGVGYSSSLSDLFGTLRLVPSDRVGESFWVRNAGTEPAYLSVAVTGVEVSDPAFAAVLTVAAGPSGDLGPAAPLGDLGDEECVTLTSGTVLGAGESTEIAAELAVGDLHGTQGQGARAVFSFRVTLSDQQTTDPGGDGCAPRTHSPAPRAPVHPARRHPACRVASRATSQAAPRPRSPGRSPAPAPPSARSSSRRARSSPPVSPRTSAPGAVRTTVAARSPGGVHHRVPRVMLSHERREPGGLQP